MTDQNRDHVTSFIPDIWVNQIAGQIRVSQGLMDTLRGPRIPLTRRQRFASWRRRTVHDFRMKLALRIAGYDVEAPF